jgi:hypothetical protein
MRPPIPTGLPLLDGLSVLTPPTLSQYIAAASEYVINAPRLSDGAKKAGQIRLSDALGRALLAELQSHLPSMGATAVVGEREVSGAARPRWFCQRDL